MEGAGEVGKLDELREFSPLGGVEFPLILPKFGGDIVQAERGE